MLRVPSEFYSWFNSDQGKGLLYFIQNAWSYRKSLNQQHLSSDKWSLWQLWMNTPFHCYIWLPLNNGRAHLTPCAHWCSTSWLPSVLCSSLLLPFSPPPLGWKPHTAPCIMLLPAVHMWNGDAAALFVFQWRGEAATELGLRTVTGGSGRTSLMSISVRRSKRKTRFFPLL